MKKVMTMILSFLKLEKFSEKDGKSTLTDNQKATVESTFGKEFTAKFVDFLAKDDQNTEPSEENSELLAELINGMAAAQNSNSTKMEESFNTQLAALIKSHEKEIKALADKVEAMANGAEDDVVPQMDDQIPRATDKPVVMKVDMRKSAYQVVGHFLKTGRMNAVEAATIEVADLAKEFGTYLSQGRNNLDEVKTIMQGFTSANIFTPMMATTEWRGWQSLITSVSQQFTPKWTPGGKTKFRPLMIRNRRHKINCPIVPAEVLESYMMHMYDEGLAPDQMPITKYIWNQLVYPQLMQDIELRMIWKGKFVEKAWADVSTGDAATPPEDSIDGIETLLVNEKALGEASTVNFFNPGEFSFTTATNEDMLDYVQQFVDWIAPLFRTKIMPIACSEEFYKRYKRAYKAVWGKGSDKSDQTTFGSDNIDFSKQFLQPIDGMYASSILFATPKANLIKLRHKSEVPNVINDVQKVDYEVRLFGEYWLGAGFAFGEAVFAAVPDGYDPKAQIAKVYKASTTFQQNKGVSGLGYVPKETGSATGL